MRVDPGLRYRLTLLDAIPSASPMVRFEPGIVRISLICFGVIRLNPRIALFRQRVVIL
jgi:hypothetical protein